MQKMDTDGITAQVEYAYVAQEADELSLTVGDIVKKCVQKENGKFINAFTFFYSDLYFLLYRATELIRTMEIFKKNIRISNDP